MIKWVKNIPFYFIEKNKIQNSRLEVFIGISIILFISLIVINAPINIFLYISLTLFLGSIMQYTIMFYKYKTSKETVDLNSSTPFINNISFETYKAWFDDSSEMICILNKEGYFIDVNKNLLNVLKVQKEALIGKNVKSISTNIEENKNRDELNLKAWNNEKKVFYNEIFTSDGKIIPLEVCMQKGKYFGKDVLISISRDVNLQKKYQDQLKKSKQKFENLFRNAPIGMSIHSLEGKFIDVNFSMEKLLGYSKKELQKLHLTEISNDIDSSVIQSLINEEIEIYEGENIFTKKNKESIYTLLKIILEKDLNNKASQLIVQIDDITQLKKAQQNLSFSENSYKQLFNNTNESIFILDFDYKVIDINQTVVEKYGYEKDELIGQSVLILSDPNKNSKLNFTDFRNSNDISSQHNSYYWGLKKDGTSFPIEIRSRKGLYFGREVIFCTGRDISERYAYEEKLRKQEERYRNLFERNLAGIFRIGLNGTIIECNYAFANFFGFKHPTELINKKNIIDFHVDKNDYYKIINRLNKDYIIKEERVSFYSKEGREVVALFNASRIRNSKNEPLYYEASLFNITEQVKTENLLKESKEQYRNLVENSASGLFIHDHGKILIANKRAAQILGFSTVDELIGYDIYRSIEPQVLGNILERVNNTLKGTDESFKEISMLKKNGDKVEIETKPIKIIIDGHPYVQITFNDITQRKRNEKSQQQITIANSINVALKRELEERKIIEESLKNSQSYTEGIIQSSIDMIYTVDMHGSINNFNTAAQQVFGYTEDEVSGKNFRILFTMPEKATEIMGKLDREGKFTSEVYCKRKNGTNFITYLSISYLYSTKGVVMGIMGVSRDITELKRNEKELKISEIRNRQQAAKLHAIIESSSHYFFTIDKNYSLTSFNKKFCKDVGLVHDINIKKGMNFFEVAFKKHEEAPKKRWKSFIDSTFKGERNQFEIKRITDNDGTVFREVFLNPIKSHTGEVEEVSGIGHDITDKKINQVKVQKSLKEKEILLKEVHHRVKNNLQVISSILSLQSSYSSDSNVVNILKESQNRIKSMAYIHESLYRTKDFSKIHFSNYVKNLTINLIETYELASCKIDLKFDLDEIFLNLDSAIPCGLIINELISNAIKYAFHGKKYGIINLILKEKEKLYLTIKDNGIGFPEQVDYKNTESLGLQLVMTLSEQINGELSMNSKNGTEFTICFPKK